MNTILIIVIIFIKDNFLNYVWFLVFHNCFWKEKAKTKNTKNILYRKMSILRRTVTIIIIVRVRRRGRWWRRRRIECSRTNLSLMRIVIVVLIIVISNMPFLTFTPHSFILFLHDCDNLLFLLELLPQFHMQHIFIFSKLLQCYHELFLQLQRSVQRTQCITQFSLAQLFNFSTATTSKSESTDVLMAFNDEASLMKIKIRLFQSFMKLFNKLHFVLLSKQQQQPVNLQLNRSICSIRHSQPFFEQLDQPSPSYHCSLKRLPSRTILAWYFLASRKKF